MVTPELIEFIKRQATQGRRPDEVNTLLLQKGWDSESIEEGLRGVNFATISAADEGDAQVEVKNFSQDPQTLGADSAYLQGFSWGYFFNPVGYGYGMHFTFFEIIQPFLYSLVCGVVIGVLSLFMGQLVLSIGPFGVIVYLVVLYRLAHNARRIARARHNWSSETAFLETQETWDRAGHLILWMGLLGIVAEIVLFAVVLQMTNR